MTPIRAETVGSFLRPEALLRARAAFKQGRLDAAALRTAEDRAIREVVALQEEIGLRLVTDGEFRRENWWIDFVARLGGVEISEGTVAFDGSYVPKQVRTTGRLRADRPIAVDDYRFLAALTATPAKVTIPSPTRLHFHGGRGAVSAAAYPDIEAFFADLAAIYRCEIAALEDAGCRFIQIDDPLLTYFLSPKLRADVVAEGDDPEARLMRYCDWINACIAGRRAGTTVAIHLCRGNARSEWIAEGAYDGIAETCFSTLKVDRYLLEFDDQRSGSFAPLRFMPPDKTVVLGLITTKRPDLEDEDMLKRRIDQAARIVDLDRLAIGPQCGFASVVEGNRITPADQRAKLDLAVAVAREVWGAA